jgi:hypothetical protein
VTTALRHPRPTFALGAVTVLLLAGCSFGTADAEPTADDTAASDSTGGDGADGLTQLGAGAGPGGNGISGLVAAVSDSLMQVQETDSQTAVTWTDETVVTRTVAVALDAIAVGSCVVAMAPAAEDGTTPVVATTVTVSEPVDEECTATFGAFQPGGPTSLEDGAERPDDGGALQLPEGGELPEGMEPPEGAELPEGMPGGAAMGTFGQLVSGRATAVSGSTLTVEATGADGVATTETVEVDAETVVTATVAADASAIAVGLCASVRGETDTRGGMTATTIALSDAGDDGCTIRMSVRGDRANDD